MSSIEKIRACLCDAYELFKGDNSGDNANYIPYLENIDSSLFAISVCLPNGEVFSVGDSDYGFGIESISKVATAILAMQQHSSEEVMRKIGADATGLPFNSIAAMVDSHHRSLSPLVNAGAISCCSMITPTGDLEAKWHEISMVHQKLCGSKLHLIDELYHSESLTNYNNRALAWILKKDELIYDEPELSLNLYTRQCSMSVSCEQLAIFGATIANKGINPVTNEFVFCNTITPQILSLMTIQGFYEESGYWLYSAGIPAKTGVGGGIVGVVPGKLGIAAFSPKLDSSGNSVRAQNAIKYIINELGLNMFM